MDISFNSPHVERKSPGKYFHQCQSNIYKRDKRNRTKS